MCKLKSAYWIIQRIYKKKNTESIKIILITTEMTFLALVHILNPISIGPEIPNSGDGQNYSSQFSNGFWHKQKNISFLIKMLQISHVMVCFCEFYSCKAVAEDQG